MGRQLAQLLLDAANLLGQRRQLGGEARIGRARLARRIARRLERRDSLRAACAFRLLERARARLAAASASGQLLAPARKHGRLLGALGLELAQPRALAQAGRTRPAASGRRTKPSQRHRPPSLLTRRWPCRSRACSPAAAAGSATPIWASLRASAGGPLTKRSSGVQPGGSAGASSRAAASIAPMHRRRPDPGRRPDRRRAPPPTPRHSLPAPRPDRSRRRRRPSARPGRRAHRPRRADARATAC